MPRRPTARRRPEARPRTGPRPGRRRLFGAAVGLVIALGLGSAWLLGRPTARQAALAAEAGAKRGGPGAGARWRAARDAWATVNASGDADARSWIGAARASLALGRAAEA